ncbi:MAG: homocysteine S-methyltransferase family protein [Planctomycetes bacterium]|nr:homocysteine S-methyltransferase family protein [Planctomycetota bacterium]
MTLSPDAASTRVHGGATLAEAARALAEAGASALGLNCSAGSAQVLRALPELVAATRLPVLVKPNAGAPRLEAGGLVWDQPPEAFAADLAEAVRLGAAAVGGCCGTDARHLRATRARLTVP